MIRTLITFGLGVYTGIYVAQNYEVKKMDDPATMWEKLIKYVEATMKKES